MKFVINENWTFNEYMEAISNNKEVMECINKLCDMKGYKGKKRVKEIENYKKVNVEQLFNMLNNGGFVGKN